MILAHLSLPLSHAFSPALPHSLPPSLPPSLTPSLPPSQALSTLKQKVRKYNKDFEELVIHCRDNPSMYEETDEDDEGEGDEERDSEEEEDSNEKGITLWCHHV